MFFFKLIKVHLLVSELYCSSVMAGRSETGNFREISRGIVFPPILAKCGRILSKVVVSNFESGDRRRETWCFETEHRSARPFLLAETSVNVSVA